MKQKLASPKKHDNAVQSVAVLPPPSLPAEGSQRPPGAEAAAQRQFAIESLQRAQRADAFFNTLSDDQRSQLLEWLVQIDDLGIVYERVIAPPPRGFGLKTHLTTLRRLRAHWNAVALNMRTEEMLDCIHDMETRPEISPLDRVQHAITHLLHEKAFELARLHPGSPVMTQVLASIEKLSTLELKRQKLALDRERLNRQPPNSSKHHRVDLNIVRPEAPPLPAVKPSGLVAPSITSTE